MAFCSIRTLDRSPFSIALPLHSIGDSIPHGRTLGRLQPRPPLHSLLPSSALSSLSTPPLPTHHDAHQQHAGGGATRATKRAAGRRRTMCRRRKGQAQVADGGSGAGAGDRWRERHGLSWPTAVGRRRYCLVDFAVSTFSNHVAIP
uniref:Uncharacterized protein n=1 Tax=Oryza nivara TaxID=4536 RepID=A0A0E0J4B1_ORYNI